MENKEKEIKREILIGNIRQILEEMYEYLREVETEEQETNEGALSQYKIDKYYKRLEWEYRKYEK